MNNKNMYELVKKVYDLPEELRTRFNTSVVDRLINITSMDSRGITSRAEKVIEYWSEDKMNEYLAKYSIADPIDRKMYDLNWVNHNTSSKELIEICLQIYRLFKRIGIEIPLYKAYFIWCYVANNVYTNTPFRRCGKWIPKRDNTVCWVLILESFIFNQPKDIEEEIFGSESNS